MNHELKKGVDFIGVTVSYICHDGHGRIVMAKRSTNCRDEHGAWDPGGGGLEFGDTVEDTLRREIKEEYCADVIEHEFICYRDQHRVHDGKPTHWIGLYFAVRVDPAKVKNGEPHKFDDIGWFTLDALPTPLHSQFPIFLETYGDRLAAIVNGHLKQSTLSVDA